MAATPIAAETRYFNPETTKVYWVPTISNKAAPTRSELNAGTDVSRAIADVNGWQVSSEMIDVPDMGSRFISKIPGRISANDSSITYYMDTAGVDARTVMPRDTTGYIVWLDGGDVAGRKCDVFPVTVSSHGKSRSAGAEPARITIQYAITSEPAENVSIPS
ncbi:hypothetical protein FLW53_09625 [Microbispora sp. SCL1-1]|uniref:phage tail tube protein n=1 Tax=unclassified Microbispora TaxID=2614687 RepID=UPI00115A2FB6|nr:MULTISPECIES: hypothetical protein [unclassified Microbispora]NJP24463.1 hypothetical protein [Microbispora sp. CL1-1]TQS14609.1 hypothetical protein FLW53_09625 [Microbispora sp. SCL1-1]